MYTNNWKNGIKLTILQKDITRDGGQKTTTEVIVYENIPAYIMQVKESKFSRELWQMTSNDQIVIKVGKKPWITQRMKAVINDKDGGQIGEYIINDVNPKRDRWRLIGFYLILERVWKIIWT